MKNEFMTDAEYEKCFMDFWGIRAKIAATLIPYGLQSGVFVLDVPSGHGILAYEVAKIIKQGEIHAVGLKNDLETFKQFSRSLKTKKEQKFLNLITYHVMDATQLTFPLGKFDFVVNFLGLEDINMTRGAQGVKQSLAEFVRVLKRNGVIQLTLWLEGNEPDEELAKEIHEFIGFNAIFYPKDFYIQELENLGVEILSENWFYTQRKMTAAQAKEELFFACTETAKIFQEYNIQTVSFEELWEQFGNQIETHGMAYYSDLCVLIGRKG
ncbi:MAG: class I SAM-dependent methyltransferase [Candidatus Hermodarchaeota archaeon]